VAGTISLFQETQVSQSDNFYRNAIRCQAVALFVRTGESLTVSATAHLSNNTTRAATNANWSTSNSTVVSVTEGGIVAALNQGAATISVTAEGQTTSIPVTVWQNYQGTWHGQYRIRVCPAAGDFNAIDWCSADLFAAGQLLPVRVILTQTNSPSVNGTIELGSVVGTVRTQLAGSFVRTVTSAGASGQGYNELDLVRMTRTSGLTTALRAKTPRIGSIPELFDAMKAEVALAW
jgi:hypothetical protein